MRRCDVMVVGGDVPELAAAGSSLGDHAVAVVGDRIAEVGSRTEMLERWDPARSVDATGCVAAPRFVDAHVHLSASMATPRRAALTANREAGGSDDALVLEDAVAMATNSSVAMGRPGDLGSIRAGQLADIVVIDPTGAHHLGSRHPIPAIALRGRPNDVLAVAGNGAVVVDDAEVTTIDTSAVLAEATAMLRSIGH